MTMRNCYVIFPPEAGRAVATGFVEMTLALERRRAWDAGEEAPEVFGNGFSAEELSWMADKVGTFKHGEACLKAQKPNLG
jgi:hypothetical protein